MHTKNGGGEQAGLLSDSCCRPLPGELPSFPLVAPPPHELTASVLWGRPPLPLPYAPGPSIREPSQAAALVALTCIAGWRNARGICGTAGSQRSGYSWCFGVMQFQNTAHPAQHEAISTAHCVLPWTAVGFNHTQPQPPPRTKGVHPALPLFACCTACGNVELDLTWSCLNQSTSKAQPKQSNRQ